MTPLNIRQEALSDRAEDILDKAIADGETFSEGLCNWALRLAEQQIPQEPKKET